MKTFWAAILFTALMGLSFLAGRLTGPVTAPLARVDTVIINDTIRDTVLLPKIRYLARTDTVFLRAAGDTVLIAVEIPVERKIYQTADYSATIEGFRASLIDMEIYRQTHYITRTETMRVPDRHRWGIGVQIGYGYGFDRLYPYIGVGLQYSIVTW